MTGKDVLGLAVVHRATLAPVLAGRPFVIRPVAAPGTQVSAIRLDATIAEVHARVALLAGGDLALAGPFARLRGIDGDARSLLRQLRLPLTEGLAAQERDAVLEAGDAVAGFYGSLLAGAPLGEGWVADVQIPGGVWIRPTGPAAHVATARATLTDRPRFPETGLIVVGMVGRPVPPKVWQTVVRALARTSAQERATLRLRAIDTAPSARRLLASLVTTELVITTESLPYTDPSWRISFHDEQAEGAEGRSQPLVTGTRSGYFVPGTQTGDVAGGEDLVAARWFPEVGNAVVLHVHLDEAGNFLVGGRALTPAEFHEVVVRSLGQPAGEVLILVACQAALVPAGGEAAAAVLAGRGERPVLAARADAFSTSDGRVVAARQRFDAEGRSFLDTASAAWVLVTADGEQAEFGHDLLEVLDDETGRLAGALPRGVAVPVVRDGAGYDPPQQDVRWAGGGQQPGRGRRRASTSAADRARALDAAAKAARVARVARRQAAARSEAARRAAQGAGPGLAGLLAPDRVQDRVVAARGLRVVPVGAGEGSLMSSLLASEPEAFGGIREPAVLRGYLAWFGGEEVASDEEARLVSAASRFSLTVTIVEPGGVLWVVGAGSRPVTIVRVPGHWHGTGPAAGFFGAGLAGLLQQERAAWLAGDEVGRVRAEQATDQALAREPGEGEAEDDDADLMDNLHAAILHWRVHRHLEAPKPHPVTLPGGRVVDLGAWLSNIRQGKASVAWTRPSLGVMGMRWQGGPRQGVPPARAALAERLRDEARAVGPDAIGAARWETDKAFDARLRQDGNVARLREAVARWRATGSLDLPLGAGPGELDEWLERILSGEIKPDPWMRAALGWLGIRWRPGADRAQLAVLLDVERNARLSRDIAAIGRAQDATDEALVPLPGDSKADAKLLEWLRAAVVYWRQNRHLEVPGQWPVPRPAGSQVQEGGGEPQPLQLGSWVANIRRGYVASWTHPALDVMGMRWQPHPGGQIPVEAAESCGRKTRLGCARRMLLAAVTTSRPPRLLRLPGPQVSRQMSCSRVRAVRRTRRGWSRRSGGGG